MKSININNKYPHKNNAILERFQIIQIGNERSIVLHYKINYELQYNKTTTHAKNLLMIENNYLMLLDEMGLVF